VWSLLCSTGKILSVRPSSLGQEKGGTETQQGLWEAFEHSTSHKGQETVLIAQLQCIWGTGRTLTPEQYSLVLSTQETFRSGSERPVTGAFLSPLDKGCRGVHRLTSSHTDSLPILRFQDMGSISFYQPLPSPEPSFHSVE
jgi:hypothetical protein